MMRFLLLALLLLSAASFGGTKVTPNVGSNMSILNSSNTGYLSGTNYWKQGDTVTSYMERLGRHTPIGVTPSRSVPTGRIASAAKDLIRLSPAAIVSSVGLMAIVEAAGWAIDELTGQLMKSELICPDGDSCTPIAGQHNVNSMCHVSNSSAIMEIDTPTLVYSSTSVGGQPAGSLFSVVVTHGVPSGATFVTNCTNRYGGGRYPTQDGYFPKLYITPVDPATLPQPVPAPVTPADIDSLVIPTETPAFYDGLMRDSCNLSSSPTRCFDSLSDQHKLEGPATVSGPKTTTTSTQTNADGTTTTVTKDTQTDFDITYGDDDFVYTPRTTTETKVDGQTTETTTEQEDTDADSEQKPEEEAVSEIAGLQCEAAVSCSGDAIQCAIAKTQKDTKCILQDAFDYSSQKSDVETVFQGDDYVIEDEEIDIPSFIGQGARFLPATCPAPIPMSLSGKTYSLDTQPFCTFATDLSFLIVAFATLAAALYIGRAFGGE